MIETSHEIRRLFEQEAREKKRTGIGVFSRASRRGYTGTIVNHYDRLSAKEKRALEGVVYVYNERDDIENIKSYDEIMEMNASEGKAYIEDIRQRHTAVALRKYWGVTNYAVYSKLFKHFNIEVGEARRKKNDTVDARKDATEELEVLDGYNIQLIGNFKGDELESRMLLLADLLREDTTYSIFLELKERGKI